MLLKPPKAHSKGGGSGVKQSLGYVNISFEGYIMSSLRWGLAWVVALHRGLVVAYLLDAPMWPNQQVPYRA